ncbi:MAG: S8 family serine peptidase [Acidimicrobiales bacterium]
MAIVLAGLLGAAPVVASPPEPPDEPRFEVPDRRPTGPARLSTALHDELAAAEGRPVPAVSGQAPQHGTITVVVEGDLDAVRRAVRDSGGTVDTEVAGAVEARVPAGALDQVAAASGVTLVREPQRLIPLAQSEGVVASNTDAWHGAGLDGAGTKVAILDTGFDLHASRLGTELPATVETDFARCANPSSTEHGTAAAEIVHDMAPGATLRLVCVDTDVDMANALGFMLANGVDVVSASIGLLVDNGARGDGSGAAGSVNAAVAALRQQGVLFVESAGNYGGSHRHQSAVGDPVPGIVAENDDFVDISPDDILLFQVPPGGSASVTLRWDGWGSTQDFDLYVYDPTVPPGSEPVLFSINDQAGGYPQPVEYIPFDNPTGEWQLFELAIDRWSGSATPRLDLFFDGPVVLEPGHATGSNLAEPAPSPSVMAVGAACVATGGIQPYSSVGPTIDGRVKPDITGPDATDSSVYGDSTGCFDGFTGTSAAAPHVAGAAAVLLEANPSLDVAELQAILEHRAQDAGEAGRDNTYGAGLLDLADPTAGADPPLPVPYQPVNPPTRLLDTRGGVQGAAEPVDRSTPLAPGEEAVLPVAGIAGIPADATAVVLNVTVTAPTAGGYLTVFPNGELRPNVSSLNFTAGLTIANHVTATVGAGGTIRLFNPFGSTHVIVDVAGWYGPTGSGLFTALDTPARAVDTRTGAGGVVGTLGPGQTRTYQLAGLHGVPDTAEAVILNVTVTGPTAPSYLTVWPSGVAQPTVSSSNYGPGTTIASLVVATVGTDDRVAFFNATGSTHLIVDVLGWLGPGGSNGYVPLDVPVRNLDTRTGTGPRLGALAGGETFNLQAGRLYGVPGGAEAVMVNATAVAPTSNGYLTVFPSGQAAPNASNLNFGSGQVIPNAVVAGLGSLGRIALFNAFGSTHVLSDLSGYFAAPPPP